MTTLFPTKKTFLDNLKLWWANRQAAKRDAKWTPQMQMEHLRLMIQQDARWMAHVHIVDALTSRYLKALQPDWFRQIHVSSDNLRRQLKLDPHPADKDQAWKNGNSRVLHVKSGGVYKVLEIANMEHDQSSVVVYKSESDGRVWVRPLEEFADGRFVSFQENAT